jgi:tight adherence protein C
MTVFFIFLLLAYAILTIAAGKKYELSIEILSKNSYPLKAFFPGAFLLLDITGYRFNTQYDKKIALILARLYEREEVQVQMKALWANRLVYCLACAIPAAAAVAGPNSAEIEAAFLWISLIVIVFFFTERELKKRAEKRVCSIQMELPDFINKLALLLNAGLNLRRAWQKIAFESRKETPLYVETKKVAEDLSSGKSEFAAYEDFARRCRVPEVTRLITVLIQNIRRGNSDMVSVLRITANECWQVRKNAARRLGEEASTKLLLPLVLMFIAVLIIAAAPAVITMGLF